MQYRLSTLIWSALWIALAIPVVRSLPMFSLACVLLLPLPGLVTYFCLSDRDRDRPPHYWRIFIFAILLSVFLFYVGMSGPLFAIFALPDHFPILANSSWLERVVNWIYTPLSWFENDAGDSRPLFEYQYWWLRLTLVLIEAPE